MSRYAGVRDTALACQVAFESDMSADSTTASNHSFTNFMQENFESDSDEVFPLLQDMMQTPQQGMTPGGIPIDKISWLFNPKTCEETDLDSSGKGGWSRSALQQKGRSVLESITKEDTTGRDKSKRGRRSGAHRPSSEKHDGSRSKGSAPNAATEERQPTVHASPAATGTSSKATSQTAKSTKGKKPSAAVVPNKSKKTPSDEGVPVKIEFHQMEEPMKVVLAANRLGPSVVEKPPEQTQRLARGATYCRLSL